MGSPTLTCYLKRQIKGQENEIIGFLKSDSYYKHNDSIKIKLIIDNNITDLNYMFEGCKSLLSIRDISLDIPNINKPFYEYNSNNSNEKSDNSNVNKKGENFHSDKLTLSPIQKNTNSSEYTITNDFNDFKDNILSNVTKMNHMFSGCSSLISLPDLSNGILRMLVICVLCFQDVLH